MKENIYDNKAFFEKYSQMSRSKDGLLAAGEWTTLRQLLPNFAGANVLDLGCGYGWHCLYAVENGADRVVGVDISSKMLEVARLKASSDKISFVCAAMEDIDFENESFDIIISSLALHYVQDYELVIGKIAKCLKKGGKFVFSCEHPIFTAYGTQDWIYDESGNIKHFPVDNYFIEGERKAIFLGAEVIKYHRTITTYLKVLQSNKLTLDEVVEPMPTKQAIESVAGMADELRRPMMLIVATTKK